MIRDVLVFPDRRLKSPAAPVRVHGPALRALARDLRDTAARYPRTVGLAATQIGVMWRVVFVDCTDHPKVPDPLGPLVLVNPVVTASEGWQVGREGCLSLPEITADVGRAEHVEVAASDVDGAPLLLRADGFQARVLLHEIDHLDGVLILDRVASLARDVFPRRARGASRDPGAVLVERAATLGRIAHAGQRYAAGPYTDHLEAVQGVLAEHGVDDPELLAAAWLHDVVEDTPVPLSAIAGTFGERVAALVDALTVRERPDMTAAHEDSWSRIAAVPGAVVVKLADRIANVRAGRAMMARYLRMAPRFREILEVADAGGEADRVGRMWVTLEAALAAGRADLENAGGASGTRG